MVRWQRGTNSASMREAVSVRWRHKAHSRGVSITLPHVDLARIFMLYFDQKLMMRSIKPARNLNTIAMGR